MIRITQSTVISFSIMAMIVMSFECQHIEAHIDGSVQDYNISTASAMELCHLKNGRHFVLVSMC